MDMGDRWVVLVCALIGLTIFAALFLGFLYALSAKKLKAAEAKGKGRRRRHAIDYEPLEEQDHQDMLDEEDGRE